MLVSNGKLYLISQAANSITHSREVLLALHTTNYGISSVASDILNEVTSATPSNVSPFGRMIVDVMTSPNTLVKCKRITAVRSGRQHPPSVIISDKISSFCSTKAFLSDVTRLEYMTMSLAIDLGYDVEKVLAAYKHLDPGADMYFYVYDLKEVFDNMTIEPLQLQMATVDIRGDFLQAV